MYIIKVLDDVDFNNLPYKHVRESLGCADPKTNTAYIRRTHWGEVSNTVDLLTLQHELDELLATVSPHEEDGIRYKKGRDIFGVVGPAILSAFNPALGALSAAGYQGYKVSKGESAPWQIPLSAALTFAGGKAFRGMDAFKAGAEASKGVGGGWFGQTLSGAQSVLGFTPGAVSTMSQMGLPAASGMGLAPSAATRYGTVASLLGQGAAAGGASNIGAPTFEYGGRSYTAAPPGVSTTPGAVSSEYSPYGIYGYPTGGQPEGVTSLLRQGVGGINIGMSPGYETGTTAETARGAITPTNIMSSLDNPMVKLGLGAMGLSALPIESSPPQLGDTIAKWLTSDTVTAAGKKAQQIADTTYLGDFAPSKEIIAYTDVMEKDIRKAYKQRREDLDRMGVAMSDQFMTSGERLEMLRRLEEEEQTEVDRMKAEWLLQAKQQHSVMQYNYVMNQINADEQVKRELLYADVYDIMHKYNLKQEDIMNFRKIAADAGMYLLGRGLGIA